MKKRMFGLLTALALCLILLPGTALAEEDGGAVTITSTDKQSTTLVAGRFYIQQSNGGVLPLEEEPNSGNYLRYSDGVLTVHGDVSLQGGTVSVNSDLIITGEENSSLTVTDGSAGFLLKNGSTLTLGGKVSFTTGILALSDGARGSFTTTSDYLGNIDIGVSEGVAFDVQSSKSIHLTGAPSYPSLTLKSQGDIFFEDVNIACLNATATLESEADVTLQAYSSDHIVFNGNSLTIRAAGDVTISGGTTAAIMGSAEISARGRVTIRSSGVPVKAPFGGTASLTVKNTPEVFIFGTSSVDAPLISVPVKFEDCAEASITDTGNGELLGTDATLTSNVPIRVRKNSEEKLYIDGKLWAKGTDITSGNTQGIASDTPTAYKAGTGWVLYEPPAEGGAAKVTLDNAQCPDGGISVGGVSAVSVEVKGENRIGSITAEGSVTVTETNGTLNALVCGTSSEKDDYTVYGEAELGDPISLGPIAFGDEGASGRKTSSLTVTKGAKLTIPKMTAPGGGEGVGLTIFGAAYLKNQGTIVNNGTVALMGDAAKNADAQTVISLGFEGVGSVVVAATGESMKTYTNSGVMLRDPAGTLDLHDASRTEQENAESWEKYGYKWEAELDNSTPPKITKGTLTLAPGFNATEVRLPGDGAEVTVETTGDSRIGTLAYGAGGGSSTSIQLTFKGGKLTVDEHIDFCGAPGSSVTIAENAVVEANKGLTVGAAGGVGGKVTVNGSLTAKGTETKPAVLTGKAEVGPTGKLEVSGHTGVSLGGMSTDAGKMDFAGAFTVRPGGSFEASCNPTVILASPNPAEFQEATEKEVIVVPDGYLPPNCELKFTKENKELTIPGDGTRFIISILNVPPAPPPTPSHTHKWAEAWTSDQTHHWHACTASGCSITEDSQKDGYGEHAYSGDWDEVCGVCGYTRTVDRPGSSGSDSSSDRVVQSRPVFSVTVEPAEHGKVVSDHASAGNGSSVTLTVRPDEGYQLESLTVADRRGNRIKLSELGGGKYAFDMPDDSVTVRAAFKALEEQDCPSRAFSDLDTGAWYHEATDFVLEAELMNGYSDGTFRPNGFLSRAQLSQILYNRAGRPAGGSSSVFADVPEDAWCAKAVSWAAEAGIVTGYAGGSFLPDSRITREQLVVMLWRCAGRPAPSGTALDFADAEAAGDYAREALLWAVEQGVLSGYGDGRLDPKGLATRAQAAQMLQNYLKTL